MIALNAATAKLDLHVAGIEPLHRGALRAFEDGKLDRQAGNYALGTIAPRFKGEYQAAYGLPGRLIFS